MDLDSKGLISWFARNPVAANLVMVLVFFAGTLSLLSMSKEIFPRTETRVISIGAPYPGAAPVEVEKGVILPMESALEGLQGIKKNHLCSGSRLCSDLLGDRSQRRYQ